MAIKEMLHSLYIMLTIIVDTNITQQGHVTIFSWDQIKYQIMSDFSPKFGTVADFMD